MVLFFFIPLEFITGLLQNIGTHVDPIKLIQVRYVCASFSMGSNKGLLLLPLQACGGDDVSRSLFDEGGHNLHRRIVL